MLGESTIDFQPTRKPRVVVLLGPPASGKGTLAKHLADSLNLPLFLPGVIYRELRSQDTPLGKLVRESLHGGGYCPDHITNGIFSDTLSDNTGRALICDGYPRSKAQLDHLTQSCEVVAWINLTAPYETLMGKATGRRECPACGASFNVYGGVAPCQCVNEDEWITRFDDTVEMFERRMGTFNRETLPIIGAVEEHYPNTFLHFNVFEDDQANEKIASTVAERLKREDR